MSTRDILEQLADDARRLRVARKLPEGTLGWDWVERVRDDFQRFIDETGLSQSKVSKMMGEGFSTSTLSGFLAIKKDDDYIGDRDRLVRGINQFMETYARRTEAPRPAGWIDTEVARRMLNLIAKTIELRGMGLIYSDAGRGKSITAQAAHQIYPGSILVRVIRGAKGASGFARLLAHQLKVREARTTLAIELKLIDILKGTDRPLLIDEAHQLEEPALEFVRDLHDACEIPIVFLGTKKIEDKCADTDIFFGQMASRIAMRYDVTEQLGDGTGGSGGNGKPLHTVDEIRRMFESDKLRLTDDGRIMLTKLANVQGLGGFRLCKQVVLVAAGVAKGNAIDGKTILSVLRGMHGMNYAVTRIGRKVEDSKVKVA